MIGKLCNHCNLVLHEQFFIFLLVSSFLTFCLPFSSFFFSPHSKLIFGNADVVQREVVELKSQPNHIQVQTKISPPWFNYILTMFWWVLCWKNVYEGFVVVRPKEELIIESHNAFLLVWHLLKIMIFQAGSRVVRFLQAEIYQKKVVAETLPFKWQGQSLYKCIFCDTCLRCAVWNHVQI